MYAERRQNMLSHTLPSIEEFAAFLDGNLSQNEMQQFSEIAVDNDALRQLLDANSVINETLNNMTEADLQLPSDLAETDFDLPTLLPGEVSALVALSPEPVDDVLVAACAADEISAYSDIEQDNHVIIGEGMYNDSSQTTPDDNGFDSSGDLSDSFFE